MMHGPLNVKLATIRYITRVKYSDYIFPPVN